MSVLSTAAESLASVMVSGLIHGTALAAVTALVVAMMGARLRPSLVAALWTIVLLKFLVPVGPQLPWSVSSAVQGLLGPAPAPALAAAVGGGGGGPVAGASGGASAALVLLMAAWAAVAAVLLFRRFGRAVRQRRQADQLPFGDAEVFEITVRLSRRLRLRRVPEVRRCPGPGAYVVGLGRPVLVVPVWLGSCGPALEAAVAHELAHLRRGDLWWRAVEMVAGCLFFFWPVVAWVTRALDGSRELACDRAAVARAGVGARSLARALAETARRSLAGAAPSGAVEILGRRGTLTRRIDRLLSGRRSVAGVGRLGALSLAAWGGIALAGGPGTAVSSLSQEGLACAVDPDVAAQILASHPDADADGDGVLSKDEACAHQLRMKQRILDEVVDVGLISQIDPDADLDGDGVLSAAELERFRTAAQVDVSVAPGGAEVAISMGGTRRTPLTGDRLLLAAADSGAAICETRPCLAQARDTENAGDSVIVIDVAVPQHQE